MTNKKKLKTATRENFLENVQAAILNRQAVDIPEWGMTVHLQEMTAAQQEEIRNRAEKEGTGIRQAVSILAMVLVDKDGKPLMDEDQVSILMAQSGRILTDLVKKAAKMNNLEVEEIEGN